MTIAPASALWDFKAEQPALPGAEALAQAAALVDYTQVSITAAGVRLGAGQSIDLGGIAKGYVADALVSFLADRGVTDALINIGGNVKALGQNENHSNWQIAIQDPGGQYGNAAGIVSLPSGYSLVTSGVYERGFDLDGIRYHHILDPHTGYPIQNGVGIRQHIGQEQPAGGRPEHRLFRPGSGRRAPPGDVLWSGSILYPGGRKYHVYGRNGGLAKPWIRICSAASMKWTCAMARF